MRESPFYGWLSLSVFSLIGIAYFAHHYTILPNENETVLSQLARTVFSKGLVYYTIQFATALILILAANTSFADFPRLSSIMAADRYLPRQLSNRGDKLVFSNGILILGFSFRPAFGAVQRRYPFAHSSLCSRRISRPLLYPRRAWSGTG